MYTFQSEALTVFDYKCIDLSRLGDPFEIDREAIDEEIARLQKKHTRLLSVETVEDGDFVTLSCVSQAPKFNKPTLSLVAGKGLYSRELEAQLLGKGKDSFLCTADGEAVEVTVLDIQRRVIPEISDEAVESWNLPGIVCLQQLWESLVEQQKQAYREEWVGGVSMYLSRESCSQSSFRLDEEEVEMAKRDSRSFANELIRSAGFDPETVTDAEMQQNFGRSLEEHYTFIEELVMEELKSAVLGCKIMAENGVSFTRESYEASLEEIRECFGFDRTQAEAYFPPFKFAKQFAANYKADQIESYVQNYFDKEKAL